MRDRDIDEECQFDSRQDKEINVWRCTPSVSELSSSMSVTDMKQKIDSGLENEGKKLTEELNILRREGLFLRPSG